MIRRCAVALCVLVVSAGVSACATFNRNDAAATVNGTELTHDQMQAILESDLAAELLQFTPGAEEVSGDVARTLISVWVRLDLWHSSVTVPPEVTAQVEQQASAQFGEQWTTAPEDLRQLLLTNGEIGTLLQDGTLTQAQLLEFVAEADITVDSRYGVWDAEQSQVVALG